MINDLAYAISAVWLGVEEKVKKKKKLCCVETYSCSIGSKQFLFFTRHLNVLYERALLVLSPLFKCHYFT